MFIVTIKMQMLGLCGVHSTALRFPVDYITYYASKRYVLVLALCLCCGQLVDQSLNCCGVFRFIHTASLVPPSQQ